jgi:hypothetical protein
MRIFPRIETSLAEQNKEHQIQSQNSLFNLSVITSAVLLIAKSFW